MDPQSLARVLGISRVVIGAALLAVPKQAGGAWLGATAEQPAGQLPIASLGARDVALGAGTVWATGGRKREVRPWLLAAAVGDVADFAGALRHREGLSTGAIALTVVMAGGGAAAGLWLANELD